MTARSGTSPTPRWVTTRLAAKHLDMTEDALRRTLERHARRGEDGVVFAEIDGVLGRRFGRRWRIAFSSAWALAGSVIEREST